MGGLIFLAALGSCIAVSYFLKDRISGQADGISVAIALLMISVLIGCGEKDEADRQMQELCAKDGGVKVYETVKVPKKQFDKWGMPRGKNWDGSNFPSTLDPEYQLKATSMFLKRGDPLKGEVEMWKDATKIYRHSDGKILGESVTYGRRGGDLYIALLLGGHPSGGHCPILEKSLISTVFIKGE